MAKKRPLIAVRAWNMARRYRLKQLGIVNPIFTAWACLVTRCPLSLACAMLEQESGKGRNVFGHDPVTPPQQYGGTVTKARYLRYKRLRPTHGMQGVGPCQLTWWQLQDEADRIGGCWHPKANMIVGFDHLWGLVKAYGLSEGVRRYNGSGPAAYRYRDSVLAKKREWNRKLGTTR